MKDRVSQILPMAGLLAAAPVFSRCSGDGVAMALWMPSVELMKQPKALKHTPSTAFILGMSRHIWIVSLLNDEPWSFELVSKTSNFLSRIQSGSWEHKEGALAEHLERPLVLHNVALFEETLLSKVEGPRLADSIFRRWVSTQSALPSPAELKQIRHELICRIENAATAAISEFLGLIDPSIMTLLMQMDRSLVIYNYVASQSAELQRARMQFTSDFPLLAGLVSTAAAKSVWGELCSEIDRLQSPVRFLSIVLNISPSAVRAVRGVRAIDVGPYFEKRAKNLLAILNQLPVEHRPRTPAHWTVFQHEYETAKKFFGRSSAGNVLVQARLSHALRYVVGLNRPARSFSEDDVARVERLRSGILQSVYAHFGVEKKNVLGIHRRSIISRNIDGFLGSLSWPRLLELDRKWFGYYAEAVNQNAESIAFMESEQYFDFIREGVFVASNGWTVRCLLSASQLKAQGTDVGICLATAGHRSLYHDECLRGNAAIFSIHDPSRVVSSTAEFQLSVAGSVMNGAVSFHLRQHAGPKNGSPSSSSKIALDELRSHLMLQAWQAHSRSGLQALYRRAAFSDMKKGMSAAMFVASQLAFRATFGLRADQLLSQFSIELKED